jgi:hypothetical protein
MSSDPAFYVLLDSNIWITERLLQSAIGNAFLFAVSGGKGAIGVAEIVRLEVDEVLKTQADNAVELVRKNLRLLQQLSGHQLMNQVVPSTAALEAGISDRWTQLSGVIEDIPFTFDDAKSALTRILRKSPPCNENNEQFRDCCVWEAALRGGRVCLNTVSLSISGSSAGLMVNMPGSGPCARRA